MGMEVKFKFGQIVAVSDDQQKWTVRTFFCPSADKTYPTASLCESLPADQIEGDDNLERWLYVDYIENHFDLASPKNGRNRRKAA